MRAIKVELSRELKHIELHTFSDWHIGDALCDMPAIREKIDLVRDNPNAVVVCNGDLMNNATKSSVSDCYAETIPPQEQIDRLSELLEPIKDKIIMMTSGNHEARTYRESGIDLTAIVAGKLGILERYAREGGICFLRFGEQTQRGKDRGQKRMMMYSIYATHGSGGGRKEGAKAVRMADMASIIDADIYIHAHTHLPMIFKESYFRTNPMSSVVSQVEKLFVNTASTLGYGGYGQTGEFKPNSTAAPVVHLCGTHREMKATL